MTDIFHFLQKTCNLRNDPEIQRLRNRSVYFEAENITSLAPRIWELIPSDRRKANSPRIFKENIKFWTTDNILVDFVKRTLAMWVLFNTALKK